MICSNMRRNTDASVKGCSDQVSRNEGKYSCWCSIPHITFTRHTRESMILYVCCHGRATIVNQSIHVLYIFPVGAKTRKKCQSMILADESIHDPSTYQFSATSVSELTEFVKAKSSLWV